MYNFLDIGCPTSVEQIEGPNHVALEEWVWPRYASVDMCLSGEIDNNIGITNNLSAEPRIRDVPLHKSVALASSQLVEIGGVACGTHVVDVYQLDLLPSFQDVPDKVAANEP